MPRNRMMTSAVKRGRQAGAQAHAVQRGFDEHRLIEQGFDRDALRQHLLDVLERGANPVDHRQGGHAAGLANHHQRAGRAVDRDRVGLHLESVVHMRHIAHEHGAAVDLLDGKGVDRVDHVRRVVHRQAVILVADLHVARRQDDVLVLQRRAHVRGRQTARLQGLRIQIRHDDARLAAIGIGNFRAVHHGERGADDVLAQVIELGVGQRLAGQAELNDRYIRGAVAQHQRRRDVRRHVLEHDQRAARELRDGAGHIGAFVQVDLLDADALVAHRLDARDVVHQGGQLPLMQRQDAVLHVLRAHPVVGPHDRNHRDVDFGKDIDGHAQRGADPHETDEDQRSHHGVRSLERNFDNGHAGFSMATRIN